MGIKIGFFSMLQILFIGLKLTGDITWSWWWVLSPTLSILGIVGIVAVIAILAMIIMFIID